MSGSSVGRALTRHLNDHGLILSQVKYFSDSSTVHPRKVCSWVFWDLTDSTVTLSVTELVGIFEEEKKAPYDKPASRLRGNSQLLCVSLSFQAIDAGINFGSMSFNVLE